MTDPEALRIVADARKFRASSTTEAMLLQQLADALEERALSAQQARYAALEEAIGAVQAEEELPGRMPDQVRVEIESDPESVMRAVVRETKRGIIERIRALKSAPSEPKP